MQHVLTCNLTVWRLFMKKLIVAVLPLVFAFNAFASEDSPVFEHEKVGTPLTRAQVIAELMQAKKDGTIPAWNSEAYPLESAKKSTLTREEVKAEYFRALKSGELKKYQDSYLP